MAPHMSPCEKKLKFKKFQWLLTCAVVISLELIDPDTWSTISGSGRQVHRESAVKYLRVGGSTHNLTFSNAARRVQHTRNNALGNGFAGRKPADLGADLGYSEIWFSEKPQNAII